MSSLIGARRKARGMLLQALYQWAITAQSAAEIDAQFHAENNMEGVDIDYFQSMLRTISSDAGAVDAHFEEMLDRSIRELDPVTLSILRIGTREFLDRLDIPYKVVINEGINLAKKFGPTDSAKYVNSILDRLAGELRKDEVASAQRHS